ncbi:MAG TPA: hypothetical protein VMH81_38350 [Bryobacteraceae bacterium]|nr:hypothetical protein [Bryobacteraceae bacterium]
MNSPALSNGVNSGGGGVIVGLGGTGGRTDGAGGLTGGVAGGATLCGMLIGGAAAPGRLSAAVCGLDAGRAISSVRASDRSTGISRLKATVSAFCNSATLLAGGTPGAP